MPQFAVQGLDELHAVSQRGIERVGRLSAQVFEIVQAARPVTLLPDRALLAALTRRLEQAAVRAVP